MFFQLVLLFFFTQDGETGEVDNLLSFYQLPSTVVEHPRYKSIKAAYSFYNVAKKSPITDLMHDALVIAKNVSYLFIPFCNHNDLTISSATFCYVKYLISFIMQLGLCLQTDNK